MNPIAMAPEKLRLTGLIGRYLRNIQDWNKQPPTSDDCFDNVALAGALVEDLYRRTAQTSEDEIQRLTAGGPLEALNKDSIGSLHIAVNGRYVLNPGKKAEYQAMSQLDWVALRQPENLFVQVGHNHGLFEVGFSARVRYPDDPVRSITLANGADEPYFTQWRILAERLALLPPSVKRILVVLLPKVGAVGNLMPETTERHGGYAAAYDPVLSTSPRLRGKTLQRIDSAIVQVNQEIEQIVRAAARDAGNEDRLLFVDGYALMEAIDYKNLRQRSRRVRLSAKVTADNRYLDGSIRFGWPAWPDVKLTRGGLFSVDGMHPSGLGYAVLAAEVLKALGASHDAVAMLRQSFREDRLLSDYPPELDMVVGFLNILRRAINVGHFDHSVPLELNDSTHFANVLRLMKSPFTRSS